jgi:glucose-fructose oxidoreductase
MRLFNGDRKVRYAVVGLGWIAQEAILPAFTHAKDNSRLVALVTDNHEKSAELGRQYNVDHVIAYQEYEEFLKRGQVDAVYISLPNNMHCDFTVRTARAGVHVLCEKPMADNVAECEQMIRACAENRVKLMIAYRLHFEPANLRAITVVQRGQIGEPRIFSSVFTQQVEEGNVRLKKGLGGGPLMDMGVYCINAARYLFRSEPIEVFAVGANDGEPRFREVHEMASAIMRFPGDRLAQFTCSFGSFAVDSYEVAGTKGALRLRPAYNYHDEMILTLTDSENKQHEHKFSQHDQFGAELLYFSNCILENREPEPGGREGLADVRIVEALLRSMRSGQAVKLEPFDVPSRPDERQKIELRPVKPPEVVEAESPTGKK